MGMKLATALRLPPIPCLALVGAGGKTTALFQLARELEPPVVVTATAHLAVSQIPLADQHILAGTPADLEAFERKIPDGVTLITGPLEGDRTTGLSKEAIGKLHEICLKHSLPLLIEADGARRRPLKAPAGYEPPIPEFVTTVVVMSGISALGQPLTDQVVHRPEIFGRLAALPYGAEITPEAICQMLTHPEGGLKNIPPGARRIALINQADTPEAISRARSLVEKLLPIYPSVVIACLHSAAVQAVFEPVAGILLAAGESKRFGRTKQILDWHGQPFVHHVAQTALEAGLRPVILVSGAKAQQVETAVCDLPVSLVRNREWRHGQSSSIRSGLQSTPGETGAAIFLLSDQPQVPATLLRALVERHAADLAPVIAPLVQEQRANPVLFDRITFPDLLMLTGDIGGRDIFSKYPVAYLPWHDPDLLIDIDTPEDLLKLESRQ